MLCDIGGVLFCMGSAASQAQQAMINSCKTMLFSYNGAATGE